MSDLSLSNYEDASARIASNARQLVFTALLFDSLFKREKHVRWDQHEKMFDDGNNDIFDIEDTSIQIVLDAKEPDGVSGRLMRNLHIETQRVFGFEFSPRVQFNYDNGEMVGFHLYLQSAADDGANLAKNLLETHHVFANFETAFERDETDEEHDTWIGATLSFSGVIVAQKKIDLAEQREAASVLSKTIEDMDQLDVICTMGGSFSPYLKLLE